MKSLTAIVLTLAALGMVGLAADPPASQPAATQPALFSKPAEKDGLSVTVTLVKASFKPNEPLAFTVSYKNVSKTALRLPDQPGLYNYWSVKLEDAATGDVYTGKTMLPMGGRVAAKPTEPIEPNQTFNVSIELQRYGFAKGEWNRTIAVRRLPAGKFKMSITISFPEGLDPASPLSGDKSIWQGKSIVTNPVEIEVVGQPTSGPATKPARE